VGRGGIESLCRRWAIIETQAPEPGRLAGFEPIRHDASLISSDPTPSYATWVSPKSIPSRTINGMATPVPYHGRVDRVSRSFDCQLEVVPVDFDLT
jgi:hypothetical protein